ncbi:Probable serine/threonine-protein kinase DDB_G0271682, partial [Geodia barretti]
MAEQFPELKQFELTDVRKTGIKIGSGAYSTAWEVAVPGAICAAKELHKFFIDDIPAGIFHYDRHRVVKLQIVNGCQLMSTLRHPNIVQFLGVAFFPGSRLPALVMERLLTSLHDLLAPDRPPPSGAVTPLSFFSMALKCSVLHNVACGLAYLHEHSPPIIHSDMSALRIFLDSEVVAKIDLGVARMSGTVMTPAPIYMPPEVFIEKPKYSTRTDVFSLGVITIYTIGEVFPCDLLDPNYFDKKSGGLLARTELQRRAEYMRYVNEQLRACGQLRGDHPLIRLIQQCLHNGPHKRPNIREVLRLLEEARAVVRDEGSERNKRELVQSLPKIQVMTDERAQQLIDEAMELGSLQQRNVVGVITGLMGAGKTTLLSRLFGLAPPDFYTSTGVAEQSIRGFLHHILRLSAGVWQRLSYKDIREFLAPLIQAGMRKSDVDKLASCLMRDLNVQSAKPLDPLLSSTPKVSSQEEATPFVPTSPQLHEESPSCQEIFPLVTTATPKSLTKDLILELVHMIDTGGQPELMEVMPSLIHNANLALVLLDLRYGLDERPPVDCHEQGLCYKRQFQSHYTSRDVILKLASTLHAKKSQNKAFRLIIVATHRDCVEGNVAARVKALNHQLASLLLPFEDQLILFQPPDKIAFVLDLKKPDRDD